VKEKGIFLSLADNEENASEVVEVEQTDEQQQQQQQQQQEQQQQQQQHVSFYNCYNSFDYQGDFFCMHFWRKSWPSFFLQLSFLSFLVLSSPCSLIKRQREVAIFLPPPRNCFIAVLPAVYSVESGVRERQKSPN